MKNSNTDASIKLAVILLVFLVFGLIFGSIGSSLPKKEKEINAGNQEYTLAALKQPAQWLPTLNELRPAVSAPHEIVEFFWYGCSHCYGLTEAVFEFEKALPESWTFVAIPASFGNWEQDGKLFYALAELGIEKNIRFSLMQAMQADMVEMHTEEGLRKFLTLNNIDADKVFALMKSEKITEKATTAGKLFYQIAGALSVPTFIVDGQILVLADQSPANTMQTLRAIVKK